MTSLNPLHTTMQNIYNQLSNQVQSTKPGWADADVAQRLGVPAGLVQDLRNDVTAVVDGHDPEKTAANLLKGLQKLQTFVGSQGSYGNADVKELPADLGPDRDGIALVMGKDGRPEQVKMAKELPADSGPDRDGISLVMGKNGQPEQVKMAKELPADSGPDRDGISLVMGKDGQPEQISSTEAQRLESQASGSVEAKSDKVVSYLKEFLEAGATGNNAEQALKGLRDAMQHLFDDIANNPVQVRKALMNSIRSQA
jgi:hypothetical protein